MRATKPRGTRIAKSGVRRGEQIVRAMRKAEDRSTRAGP
jgi:hypothetical protein